MHFQESVARLFALCAGFLVGCRSAKQPGWFWIDDRDLKTKRAFAFMMMFFTLSETGEKENLPLITIPAQ